jgi:tetratricopeptide (TPR) repeat protein
MMLFSKHWRSLYNCFRNKMKKILHYVGWVERIFSLVENGYKFAAFVVTVILTLTYTQSARIPNETRLQENHRRDERQSLIPNLPAQAAASDTSADAALHILDSLGNRGREALDQLIYGGKIDSAVTLFYRRAVKEGATNHSTMKRVSVLYQQIGSLAFMFGILDAAEQMYLKSLTLEELLHDDESLANLYNNLGQIYFMNNDPFRAKKMHEYALRLHEELGSLTGAASQHGNLALIDLDRDDLKGVKEHYTEALNIYASFNDKVGMATSYSAIGQTLIMSGNLDAAADAFGNAHKLFADIGLAHIMHQQYRQLASLYERSGDTDKACRYWREAQALARGRGAHEMLVLATDHVRSCVPRRVPAPSR